MTTRNFLGVTALIAATSLAPSAFATRIVSGTITVLDLTVEGLPATKTVNLAGDTVTQVATCSGQVRKIIVGDGTTAIVTTAAYDAAGRLLSVRDATRAGTDYAYDALGRKLTETDAAIAGKVRRYAYDAVGHLVSSTDPLGITTTYSYDSRDRKVADSTPMNANEVRTIRYGFDGRGNRTTLTDANGAVTTWGYDNVGRQVSKTYANGDRREMAYDAAGRLVKLSDENGQDTVSVFDLAGRLLSKTWTADNSTDTYAYDAASRMSSVTKGRYNHTLAYGYDQAGRLATETHPDGTVLHLAYDAANRLASLSLTNSINSQLATDNYAVAYAFNSNGQLATVTAGDYATRYEYRANGQLASTVDYRVIDPQADILRADRTYDAGARLTEVANTAANGDQAGVRYTLALDDQRTEAVEESGAKWQYGYDSLKQLVTAKKTDTQASVIPPLDQSYAYDPMGNRRTYADQAGSTAYTTNNANQYTAVGGVASVYDHNGNLLTDGVKNYTWDAENQLTSVTPVNPTEGSAKVEYTYDWRMRRTGKKSYVYTAGNWVLSKTTGFKYHEWNLIQETITNNSQLSPVTSTKSYVWGNDLSGNLHGAGGVGGLLSMKYNGDNYFYAYDGNGNGRALVKADAANPAASSVVERYTYDGFGKELPTSTPIASRLSPFAFSTKYLEPETGINYYGYRYYKADSGRWINRDPIMEKGGVNIYSMIGNRPIGHWDTLGLKLINVPTEHLPLSEIAILAGDSDAYAYTWFETKFANGAADDIIEKKEGGKYCAEVSSAMEINFTIAVYLPRDWSSRLTARGASDVASHELRRTKYLTNAYYAFVYPIELNGGMATKCGKICSCKEGEAKERLGIYLGDLRTTAFNEMTTYINAEQSAVDSENLHWRPKIDGLDDGYDPAFVHQINEATFSGIACPQ